MLIVIQSIQLQIKKSAMDDEWQIFLWIWVVLDITPGKWGIPHWLTLPNHTRGSHFLASDPHEVIKIMLPKCIVRIVIVFAKFKYCIEAGLAWYEMNMACLNNWPKMRKIFLAKIMLRFFWYTPPLPPHLRKKRKIVPESLPSYLANIYFVIFCNLLSDVRNMKKTKLCLHPKSA